MRIIFKILTSKIVFNNILGLDKYKKETKIDKRNISV